MPTGYTADIPNQTFEQFLMACARGMGACVTMRDEPHDAEIPERFEPSNYHVEKMDDALDRLRELNTMSKSTAEANAAKDFHQEAELHAEQMAENQKRIESYREMLDQVQAWQPPSEDHVGLKEFMAEQIEKSIEFDDHSGFISEPVRMTGEQWLARQVQRAFKDVSYHAGEYQKELERVESRNKWLRLLRESLAQEPTNA